MDEPPIEPVPTTDEQEGPVVGWVAPPPASAPDTNTLELWTPSGIGWTSFFLGFPGGVVLAALNWRRVGRTRKAIAHLAAAVIGTWVLYFVAAPVLGLAAIAVSFYLYKAQRDDQSPFEAAGRVTDRNWGVGAVIALVATLLIFLPVVLIEAAAGYGEVDHRGEVLFGTGATTGGCVPPAGLATTFGPDDPIFVSAVMRETVQPGSQVVVRVEVQGETTEERPVTVEPPWDCLGSGDRSMGPLDPGTYTLRYRYNGQPATPDLASGTFTVTARPGASPSPTSSASAADNLATPTAAPRGSPSPVPSSSAAVTTTASTCLTPASGGHPHQAPEIEAILPASVAGRPLARWSVRGRCWLELAFEGKTPAAIDAFAAQLATSSNPNPINDTDLVYGVAGRSVTKTDPPFFVFASVRPANEEELTLALYLLFGGASFHDVAGAPDLTHYQTQTISGKQVYVGTADMLRQDTHERGRPFLYQTDQYMFLVITDDDEWASDAIGQLP